MYVDNLYFVIEIKIHTKQIYWGVFPIFKQTNNIAKAATWLKHLYLVY